MPLGSVTRVRYTEEEAQPILQVFIHGGHFGTDRPPRGIATDDLVEFIEKKVSVGADEDAYKKTLFALRFYEAERAVPHLLEALDLPVEGHSGFARGCYAVQIAADIGKPDQALISRLISYYDNTLVPHDEAPEMWRLLMETRVVLTPHGTDAALVKRIDDEVADKQKTERDSEADMMAFDVVSAVQRNDLPRMQRQASMKQAILDEADADKRRDALVETYLGRNYLGDMLEDWAGRMLRREAFEVNPDPVYKALADGIDNTNRGRAQAQVDLEVVRAAEAILYLGGTLSSGHKQQYDAASGVANFLWDDE